MQQDKDAEISALKAVIAAKDAEIAAKDAEIAASLDFSIHAVTTAVTLLRVNGRCDLADSLIPILNQLVERRCYNFTNEQVAHQLYRPRSIEAATVKLENVSDSVRAGEASNPAPGAMVQASTQGSTSTGEQCFEGGCYKDLFHAVLDLHLQVALLTV